MNAELIRKARELTKETQAVFGQRFGVDQSTVARWETKGPPRGAARMALAREVEAIMAKQDESEASPS